MFTTTTTATVRFLAYLLCCNGPCHGTMLQNKGRNVTIDIYSRIAKRIEDTVPICCPALWIYHGKLLLRSITVKRSYAASFLAWEC